MNAKGDYKRDLKPTPVEQAEEKMQRQVVCGHVLFDPNN